MPSANNIGVHKPFLDVWEQAAAAPRGIRVRVENPTDFRARLYHARAADRKNNAKIHPEGSLMHGKSYFDDFTVKMEPGAVRIIPNSLEIEGVEEL